MAFKLNITFSMDVGAETARILSVDILKKIKELNQVLPHPDVSLTIDGDRSGANYLAPINNRHYKHTKIPLTDVKLDPNDP